MAPPRAGSDHWGHGSNDRWAERDGPGPRGARAPRPVTRRVAPALPAARSRGEPRRARRGARQAGQRCMADGEPARQAWAGSVVPRRTSRRDPAHDHKGWSGNGARSAGGVSARRLTSASRSAPPDGYRPPPKSALAPMVETPARRQAWTNPSQGEVMPYGVYPTPEHSESTEVAQAGANRGVQIRTRFLRGRLDRQLAEGADPATTAELGLRAAQLHWTAERGRIPVSIRIASWRAVAGGRTASCSASRCSSRSPRGRRHAPIEALCVRACCAKPRRSWTRPASASRTSSWRTKTPALWKSSWARASSTRSWSAPATTSYRRRSFRSWRRRGACTECPSSRAVATTAGRGAGSAAWV